MSIADVARAMLHDQNLPNFLWGKAMNTSVYEKNMVPHQALDNNNFKEIFTGTKPNISHLGIFGCLV